MSDQVRLAAWAAILAPAGIVLHELAHFLVGLILGFPVRLGVGSVSGGPTRGSAADWEVAIQALSGPLITMVLMGIAAVGLTRRPMPKWAFALAITAPLRFIVGAVYLFWVVKAGVQGKAFEGMPNFDEYNAALALGLSPVWILTVQMLGLACFWIWSASRPVAGRRLISTLSVLFGAMVGISLWMALLGPALLGMM